MPTPGMVSSKEFQDGMQLLTKELKKPYYPNFRNIFDYLGKTWFIISSA